MSGTADVHLRALVPGDAVWARDLLATAFGSTRVVSRGRLHQADALPGLVAEWHGTPAALLTYEVRGGELEVVSLVAAAHRRGLGRALLEAAAGAARAHGCRRAWLVTTNDNSAAIEFYRRCGWRLAAVHAGAVATARELKPEIPLIGHSGVEIRDELEFELALE